MRTYIPYSLLMIVLLTACGESLQYRSAVETIENSLSPSLVIADKPKWNIQDRMEFHKVPGISLAVIKNFEVSWSQGYGVTQNQEKIPVTAHTLFQAASISKPVTAVMTLRMVQEGLLDLDRDINHYLISWKIPENKFSIREKVTIRRILSHTAGLSVSGFRGYAADESVPTLLETLDGQPPANSAPIRIIREPGSEYAYSGGGYIVLQQVLEDVTGKPVSELMRTWLLEPLGMQNSILGDPHGVIKANQISDAHNYKGEAYRGHRFIQNGSTCCELWTTAKDLAMLVVFIQRSLRGEHPELLRKDLAELLVQPDTDGNSLGFFVTTDGENSYFSHSGSNPPGFTCWLLAHASKGYGMILMTNSQTGGTLYPEIRHSISKTDQWSHFAPFSFEQFEDFIRSVREAFYTPVPNHPFSENKLNLIGYELLSMERGDKAIQVLTLNTELFPRSANCYDSLGDAWIELGDTANALKVYRDALRVIEQYPGENEGNRYLIEGYHRDFPEVFNR